jgi:serine/threonine protein kinase/prolyl-tRNA editing enzyme YbaK/EbsC (Cys-tRNA(Pro) deacylase)
MDGLMDPDRPRSTDAVTARVPARFTVVAELGRGGMGVVHQVRDDRGVMLALKGLRDLRPRQILRIKNEFRALRDIQHPNLVRLGELFEDDGRWYFTMELIGGVDFLSWVSPGAAGIDSGSMPMYSAAGPRPQSSPGTWNTSEATDQNGLLLPEVASERAATGAWRDATISNTDDAESSARPVTAVDVRRLRAALRGVVEGLSALHRVGLVHRDIKPSNIRVESGGRVVLLDFGVVAAMDRPDHEVVGTRAYMAPEQVLGEATPAIDWYAVGVMLYRALTGRLPFDGSPGGLRQRMHALPLLPTLLVRDIPQDLVVLCMRLLDPDPQTRAGEREVRAALVAGDDEATSAFIEAWQVGSGLPFVGREDELARLREIARRQRSTGAARAVVVTGASGIGKTAMVHQFLRAQGTSRDGALVLHGRCDPREVVPYNALDGIVDDLARAMADGLRVAQPPLAGAGELTRLFPVLSTALLGGSDAPVAALGRGVDRRIAALSLGELLGRTARTRPTVLFIDDLHWADHDSVALLGDVFGGETAPPLLLVATARGQADNLAAVQALQISVDEVALGGLEDTDVRHLIAAVVPGDAQLDARAVARDAGGHPMFVAELIRASHGGPERSATSNLDQALWQRACRLGGAAHLLLATVVTAAAPLGVELALTAARLEGDDGARALGELRDARMVRISRGDHGDLIEPYHDRVADAVASRMPEADRARCHDRLAAALAAAGAAPEPLAYHLAAAGKGALAARHAEVAAGRAAGALAFDRAAEWYAMAIQHGAHGAGDRHLLRVARAEMLVRAGRPRDAAEAFLAAAGDAPSPIDAIDLRRRAFEQYLLGGFLAEGVAVADEVLTALGIGLPRSTARTVAHVVWLDVVSRLSRLRWTPRSEADLSREELARIDACWSASAGLALIDPLRGAAYSARMIRLCLAAGEPFRIGRALAADTMRAACFGQGRRLANLEAAIARSTTEANQPAMKVYRSIATLTRTIFFDNDWLATIRLCEPAIAEWRATTGGLGWEADVLDVFLGWSLEATGELDKLRVHTVAAARTAQRTGNRFREIAFRCQFPQKHLLSDATATATADIDDALAAWHVPEGYDPVAMPMHYATKARTIIALYRDVHDEDEALLGGTWARIQRSLLTRLPAIAMEVALWRGSWRVARARRHPALAKELLAEASRDARRLRANKMPIASVQAALLEASIAYARGEPELAVSRLGETLPQLERRGMIGPMAAVRWRIGSAIGGDAGAALRAEATAALTAMGVSRPERMVNIWVPGWGP